MNTKREQIFKELEEHDLDIVALTETKKKGKGNELQGNYLHFYSGVDKAHRAKAGVSLAIHKKFKKHIKNWEEVNERILKLEMEMWGYSIVFLAVYAPTDDSSNEIKDEFYADLTMLLANINNRKEIVLLGDLNARVGKREEDSTVGRWGEDTLNNSGERLLDLCKSVSLRIMNGFFKHKEIHKYTWCQPTRKLRSIIDYIIIKEKTRLKMTDVRVYRGAECGTDHFLLKSKVLFKYHLQQTTKKEGNDMTIKSELKRFNLNLLKQDSIRFLYQLRLANKLRNQTTGTAAEMYNHIKSAIHEAAMEAIGEQNSQQNLGDSWWREHQHELESAIKEKKEAYQKWLTTQDQEDRNLYIRTRREVKKKTIRAKNETWEKTCQEVEQHIGGTRSQSAWNVLRSLKKEESNKINLQMIQMDQWVEYYSNMLIEKRDDYKNINIMIPEKRDVPEISVNEIKKCLKAMKNGKSPGPGGIAVELLKSAPEIALENLADIFNRCLIHEEEIPQEWKIAHLTSIHKKGSKKECSNYRGISVTATVGRLYGRILKTRIENEVEFGEEQSGFTAGRSCTDNIFTLRQVLNKRKTRNLETHLIFIDLEKAYDTVPINKLFQILNKIKLNGKYVLALKSMYENMETRIKIGNELSESIKPTKGLRQGCCISPTLFKIYINEILKEWQNKCRGMGLQIDNDYLHTLLFADDQVVLAADEYDIHYMMRKLEETYSSAGLKINFDKTKHLVVGGEKADLEINGNVVRGCKEYKYLGVNIDEGGSSASEISQRMVKGTQAISKLNSILWSENIKRNTKIRVFESIVKSIMLYGAETWELTQRNRQRLKAVEMDYMRRSCRVSRLQRVPNEEIKRRMKVEKQIDVDIEERRLKWMGHLGRMDDHRWPRKIWKWQPNERRRRGRPREEWAKQVRVDMERRGLEEDQWMNREEWKRGCERRPTVL